MRIHIRVQWGIAMGTSVRQSEAENFHVAVMKTEDARIRGNCGCTCRSQHGSASVVASTVAKKDIKIENSHCLEVIHSVNVYFKSS